MRYEIRSKSDLLTGTTLIIKIPEAEVDKKALCTIQANKPEFILPFRSRSIDGKMEFVYQIGLHSRLQYLGGGRQPKEYAKLWSGVLGPLLDCGDWFMKPYSFVLSVGFLYIDKGNRSVSYVYVPSIRDCSDYSDLKEMAAEVSKLVTVSDMNLENMVLRAIMKNFDPQGFLHMLTPYIAETHPATADQLAQEPQQTISGARSSNGSVQLPIWQEDNPASDKRDLRERAKGLTDEIIIEIPSVGAHKKRNKKSANSKGAGGDTEKPPKRSKDFLGLFGKRKDTHEIIPEAPQPARQPDLFSTQPAVPPKAPENEYSDVTQSIPIVSGGVRLRYIGQALMPLFIDIRISEGEVFSVGRFDSSVGRRQSCFEFDKKTKAVSRRHAAIERDAGGYHIVDLASSAGTFVGGQKLPPNTPCKLEDGCRVSFGNSGADYIWEEQGLYQQ